ncbi:hypothetical protein SEVIR_4G261800v4 [Setaria viridis]|uniref:TFIIS N-terminal domain-containing protein n=1 Tax=Setaria viridis TaxID=4556 RepID=A0A4V6DBX9_SETVI|nr:hypothetical protein SEVIR_4G261800v2 [Setaria viridis]
MAAARSPLRRWERFFPAFAAIDDAIEAASGHPRGEFRSVRARIVGLLRAAGDDDGVAEKLCAALDAAMEEALATLRVAAPSPPESTGLAGAVVVLSDDHESARVRGLADDVVRRWMAATEAVLVGAIRFIEVVNNSKRANEPLILRESASSIVAERTRGCDAHFAADEDKERHAPPTKTKVASLRSNPIKPANSSASVKVAAPSQNERAQGKMEENTEARRKTPAGGNGGGNRVQSEEMMEATKRKLREGYQQVEDVKRQRKIQVIEAPKMLEQRQKKMHPNLRERSRARCGSSSAVRRSLIPSLHRI